MQGNTAEDSARSSISSDTSLDSNSKQTVQLPTIRYPASAPLLVDRQRNTYLSGVSGVEYTFTQLQVAQATFRYPPTPPVEVGEGTERLLPQQACEAPALSHMSYTSNGETATSEKNTFHSLPTPPDLVPISDIPPTNISPQNCTQEMSYYRKQWSTDDVNQSPCLPSLPHAQQQPLPWSTEPMGAGGPLLHVQQHHSMQQGIKSQMQPILFSLPPTAGHSYGDGMSFFFLMSVLL